ncbi:class I SAM-dependent methyltransferase [Saccharibacillus alkalitolerans]|uniref:Class I SAM-dependent methyltransferase n=1 Tax=Saccharibacillus alkalitolerans TaxID=2705290 RepID=A0ABX0F9T9_9BACL|nr:class I SAM-dependent methyltransferase [Saccharibacillus alkalitolerans]NGZ77672.1 class I SAM-dependent methyltransferase [Saccharibacillus alkalitolerans]
MKPFFDPSVWEQEWKAYGEGAAARMRRSGIDPATAFNAKAEQFNEQSFNEEGRRRSARIVGWLESRGVKFEGATVLDVGAASGVFTVPFAERGARVTAFESSPPQVELLQRNTARFTENPVEIVSGQFEEIDIREKGWNQAFDLVFVSMCPVVHDWDSVERILSCARKFAYISMPVSSSENSLVNEVTPLITGRPFEPKVTEMGYLLHLLCLKGYAYEILVTRELKTTEHTREEALEEAMMWLRHHNLPADEGSRSRVAEHLKQAYPEEKVRVQQGGRFGKVLIRLQDQNMYAQE